MGGSGACAGVRSQLGVYLTGSQSSPPIARWWRGTWRSCAARRAELADLAGLPGLLRRPAGQAAWVPRPRIAAEGPARARRGCRSAG